MRVSRLNATFIAAVSIVLLGVLVVVFSKGQSTTEFDEVMNRLNQTHFWSRVENITQSVGLGKRLDFTAQPGVLYRIDEPPTVGGKVVMHMQTQAVNDVTELSYGLFDRNGLIISGGKGSVGPAWSGPGVNTINVSSDRLEKCYLHIGVLGQGSVRITGFGFDGPAGQQ